MAADWGTPPEARNRTLRRTIWMRVVDLPELPNPVAAKSPRHAAQQRPLTDAAGNGDGHHHVAVEVHRRNLAQQPHVLAVQLDEALGRPRQRSPPRRAGAWPSTIRRPGRLRPPPSWPSLPGCPWDQFASLRRPTGRPLRDRPVARPRPTQSVPDKVPETKPRPLVAILARARLSTGTNQSSSRRS